jgi:hypothetical protein
MAAALALFGAVPPPLWGLFVSVGTGRSMGDTGPNIRCSRIWISAVGFLESRTRRPSVGVLRL